MRVVDVLPVLRLTRVDVKQRGGGGRQVRVASARREARP
jgi:hypothetical protein